MSQKLADPESVSPQPPVQKNWPTLILWLCGLGLLSWTLSQMPLHSIVNTLGGLHWQQWLGWILVNMLVILAGTTRWHLLCRILTDAGQQVPRFLLVLFIRQAGQTISFITPGPQFGGEPFQIYWLYKRTGMALHRAVLSLGLDRFFELWINFLVLLLGASVLLLLSDSGLQTGSDWTQIVWLMSGLLLLLSVIAWLLLKRPAILSAQVGKIAARWLSSPQLKKLGDHWQFMGSDLRHLLSTQKPALFSALLLSLLGWILIVFEMWLVLGFFGIHLDIAGLVLILLAMRLALLLPLPGGIGTLEASVFWSFQSLGLPVDAALGLIAIMRLRDVLVLIAGFACARALRSPRSPQPPPQNIYQPGDGTC